MESVAEMPAALLAAAAGTAAFALTLLGGWLALRALRRPGSGRCHWRRAAQRPETALRRWVCADCGVDAWSAGRSPPRECKRSLRPAAL